MDDQVALQIAALFKAGLHLFLLYLAWKFKKPIVGILAIIFLAVHLSVFGQLNALYIITSGIAHPLLAWVLYQCMKEGKL